MNDKTLVAEFRKLNTKFSLQLQATSAENIHLHENIRLLDTMALDHAGLTHCQLKNKRRQDHLLKAREEISALTEKNAILTAKLELAEVKAEKQQLIKELLALEYIFPLYEHTARTGICPLVFKEKEWENNNARIREMNEALGLGQYRWKLVSRDLPELEKVQMETQWARVENEKMGLFALNMQELAVEHTKKADEEGDEKENEEGDENGDEERGEKREKEEAKKGDEEGEEAGDKEGGGKGKGKMVEERRRAPNQIMALMEEHMLLKENWIQHWFNMENAPSNKKRRGWFKEMRDMRMEELGLDRIKLVEEREKVNRDWMESGLAEGESEEEEFSHFSFYEWQEEDEAYRKDDGTPLSPSMCRTLRQFGVPANMWESFDFTRPSWLTPSDYSYTHDGCNICDDLYRQEMVEKEKVSERSPLSKRQKKQIKKQKQKIRKEKESKGKKKQPKGQGRIIGQNLH